MLRGIAAIICLLALTAAAHAVPSFAQRLDLIERHQVTIEARVVGVTQVDEFFWLAQQGDGIDPPRFLVVDELGSPQFTLPQTGTTTPAGVNDIHWCGTWIWGSECQLLHAWTPAGTYTDYFFGPSGYHPGDPVRTICHSEANRFWVTGHNKGIWAGYWDGNWGSQPGWMEVIPGPFPGASGLAYDQLRDWIWVTDHVLNKLSAYEVIGGPAIAEVPAIGTLYGSPRGCCMAETQTFGNVLAMVFIDDEGRQPGKLVLFEIDDTPVERRSWAVIKALFR